MEAVSYSEARKNLKKYFDHAYQNHDPVIITRKDNENIVILSLDDYNSLTETHYLLSSENNAKHLLSSLQKLRNNKGFEKEIDDE
jgi:antitoxin YefM